MPVYYDINPYVEKIHDLMVKIALKRHGDEILLILRYGSRAKDRAEPDSDIEYIALTRSNTKVDIEFTFNGIPVDMWSQRWDEVLPPQSHNVLSIGTRVLTKIVYYQNQDILQEWRDYILNVQTQDYDNRNLDIATGQMEQLLQILGRLNLAIIEEDRHEVRSCSWKIVNGTLMILSQVNNYYLRGHWGDNLVEYNEFEKHPNLYDELCTLVETNNLEKTLEIATHILNSLRKFLISFAAGKRKKVDLELMRTSDVLSYANKIRKGARKRDKYITGYAATDFQILVARDLKKLDNSWNYTSDLEFYKEYASRYDQDLADFISLASKNDYDEMLNLLNPTYSYLLEYNKTKVPDFKNIDEITAYYL